MSHRRDFIGAAGAATLAAVAAGSAQARPEMPDADTLYGHGMVWNRELPGLAGRLSLGFDVGFDDAVVTPLDVGGLFQSIYQAEFSAADPTLSDITSSGLAVPGALPGIAGSSWGSGTPGLISKSAAAAFAAWCVRGGSGPDAQ